MEQPIKEKRTGHRNCAVVGCSNNWRQLHSWMSEECAEHDCFKGMGCCVCPPPFTLYPFPTEKSHERRQAWIKNIKRKTDRDGIWQPNCNHRVCSEHFPEGQPTNDHPDPVLKMGHTSSILGKARRILKRTISSTATDRTVQKTDVNACESEANVLNSSFNMSCASELDHSYIHASKTNSFKNFNCTCQGDICECCIGCLEKSSVIRQLTQKINRLELELKMSKKKAVPPKRNVPLIEKLITSDSKAKFYTGLPSIALFVKLYEFLFPKIKKMRYWRGTVNTTVNIVRKYSSSPKKFGPQRKLSPKDELLLTLMKIRLGLSQQDLADRFKISVSLVSSVFTTWIRLLSTELYGMLEFPPKENIMSNLPKDAALFPHLRCIIDCTEIFIERPRELLIQALTWSDYKKHNTAKVLVAITPRGKICFLSKAWGGRASDVHIVNHSGFLNYIDKYDEIMADKGFTIENQLVLRGAKLIIPPGVKGQQQMLPEEVHKTKKIANFRIHVERAIGRMKAFKILSSTYPINMLPVIDDVLVTCAALCNFLPPLVTSENLYNDP